MGDVRFPSIIHRFHLNNQSPQWWRERMGVLNFFLMMYLMWCGVSYVILLKYSVCHVLWLLSSFLSFPYGGVKTTNYSWPHAILTQRKLCQSDLALHRISGIGKTLIGDLQYGSKVFHTERQMETSEERWLRVCADEILTNRNNYAIMNPCPRE